MATIIPAELDPGQEPERIASLHALQIDDESVAGYTPAGSETPCVDLTWNEKPGSNHFQRRHFPSDLERGCEALYGRSVGHRQSKHQPV